MSLDAALAADHIMVKAIIAPICSTDPRKIAARAAYDLQ
jgi:hypothetical protein